MLATTMLLRELVVRLEPLVPLKFADRFGGLEPMVVV